MIDEDTPEFTNSLAGFATEVLDKVKARIENGGTSEDDEEIMQIAWRRGLVDCVAYDPEKHGEMDSDKGDMIWWWGKS